MNTKLYSGNGSSTQCYKQVLAFNQILVWIKDLEMILVWHHYWLDAIRGATKHIQSSNSSNAEGTSNCKWFDSF